MKNSQVFLIALALLMSSVGQAAEGSQLEGRWKLVDRVCKSGARPVDGIRLNRDSITLEFKGRSVEAEIVTDSCVSKVSALYAVVGEDLVMKPTSVRSSCEFDLSRETNVVGKLIQGDSVLLLESGGFGEGGTCPSGDTLVSTFVRHP